jgi:hypothetical protein
MGSGVEKERLLHLPPGVPLDGLLDLGEAVVGAQTPRSGARTPTLVDLEDISPLKLAQFLLSKVRGCAVGHGHCPCFYDSCRLVGVIFQEVVQLLVYHSELCKGTGDWIRIRFWSGRSKINFFAGRLSHSSVTFWHSSASCRVSKHPFDRGIA